VVDLVQNPELVLGEDSVDNRKDVTKIERNTVTTETVGIIRAMRAYL
jgi:hypothetical protein